MYKFTDLLPPLVMAFIITAGFAPVGIPFLKKLKFGQSIREEGPKWHQKKAGTPTMGGLLFILGISAATVLATLNAPERNRTLTVLLSALSFGFVGFIDDYIKVVAKRNLGLTSRQKFTLQLLCAAAFLVAMELQGANDTAVPIPFISYEIELGFLYYPFAMFAIVAIVNAVNFTDGLDGLATSVTIPVAMLYLFIAFTDGFFGNSLFLAAVIGGLAAFLIFNFHPAKIFMGDTGSLFLGGVVSAAAFSMRAQLIFLLCGIIYVAEMLSVVIQVSYFKATKGKRFFKMAPLHHHFELCGWSEKKVVAVFFSVTAVLCLLSAIGV